MLTSQGSKSHISQRNGPSCMINERFQSGNFFQSLGIFAYGTVAHKSVEVVAKGENEPIKRNCPLTQRSTCFSILWVSFTALRVLHRRLFSFILPWPPVTTRLPLAITTLGLLDCPLKQKGMLFNSFSPQAGRHPSERGRAAL